MEEIEYKSELQLQSKIYTWFYNKYPEFRVGSSGKKIKQPRCLLVHNFLNPRSVQEGAKLAGCGLTKGLPDLTLFVPAGMYHGLHIELKIGKEKPKDYQIDLMNALREQGYYVTWTNNEEEAKQIISDYLYLRENETRDILI